jgi:murein DD-endopeptidase MepM/ murein hydrolase activator NlpD
MFAFATAPDYGPVSALTQDKFIASPHTPRRRDEKGPALSGHSRPPGRHRATRPPHNKAPAVLASAVVGATAAALSTAAASGAGLPAMAASVTALQAPVPNAALGMGGPEAIPNGVTAEVPMNGRTMIAAVSARNRVETIQASRAARAHQVALIEAARPKWILPMPKGSFVISSCFEPRWGTFHYGVDMAAPGGTPFHAAGDGTVIEAGPMNGYGNVIMIQHADDTITVYGHEEKILVQKGEKVKAGQLIGLVGSEGESTGYHLHFEIRVGSESGEKTDPMDWLDARGIPLSGCGHQ